MEVAVHEKEYVEARRSQRKPLSRQAYIYCHGYPSAYGRIRNLGPDGLLLKTNSLDISRNTLVEVEFSLTDRQSTQQHRLPVFIGRRSNDRSAEGIELVFYEFKVKELLDFRQELRSLADESQPDDMALEKV